jgi:hypothetical protein
VLQHEGRGKAKDHTEGHGDGELEEEDGDAMKKGGREDVLAVKLGERSGRRRRMEEGRLIGGGVKMKERVRKGGENERMDVRLAD